MNKTVKFLCGIIMAACGIYTAYIGGKHIGESLVDTES